MKRYILYLMFLPAFGVQGQDVKPGKTISLTAQAQRHIHEGSVRFNPAKAFKLYKLAAEQGDPKAMNALGILYSDGIGIIKNEEEALRWFEKAANLGYTKAWYNLGMAYKNGIGVPQNFEKAFNCFNSAAKANLLLGIYSKGFMLYKGLGCTQSYKEAFKNFYEGAHRQSPGSMYMLGLCYRNGYGTDVNVDSARYWLKLSAARGYKQATDELNSAEPENVIASASMNHSVSTTANTQKLPKAYQKIKQQISKAEVIGLYNGYAIKYDWSGKNIVHTSKLKLEIKLVDNLLTGTWTEDSVTTSLEAKYTDTALIFNNTVYSQKDHYNHVSPNVLQFKNARLRLVRTADSIYLAGNLQLYSLRLKEPEKPVYISLIKTDDKQVVRLEPLAMPSDDANLPENLSLKASSVSNLLVYPNPFSKELYVDFNLQVKSKVNIQLSSVEGKLVYQSKQEVLEPGKYQRTIHTNIPAGIYVLVLHCNGRPKSSVIIKQ